MKIKSLLIGSAALMTASSGAYAADAIVMADPEPVEYVRVCDVYGAGFFYIPGTETCLKIGGYVRFEVSMSNDTVGTTNSARATYLAVTGGLPITSGLGTRGRFAPSFDVRSETEWGTLRAFAELEFDRNNNFYGSGSAGSGALGSGMFTNMPHAFIELTTGTGTLRLGRTQRPYARFLGFGTGAVMGGVYGYGEANEVSYTFSGGNGFSAIVALVDDGTFNWMPDVEGGVNFAQGWGSIGAIVGYDESSGNWGAKAVARFRRGADMGFSGGLHVFYSSGGFAGVNSYGIADPMTAGIATWSVLGHAQYRFSPKAAAFLSAQWFDLQAVGFTDAWEVIGGFDFNPVSQFRIRPEVRFNTSQGVSAWSGVVRFDRTF